LDSHEHYKCSANNNISKKCSFNKILKGKSANINYNGDVIVLGLRGKDYLLQLS